MPQRSKENSLYHNGIFMQYQQVTEALKPKIDMIILKGGKITSIRKFLCKNLFLDAKYFSEDREIVDSLIQDVTNARDS